MKKKPHFKYLRTCLQRYRLAQEWVEAGRFEGRGMIYLPPRLPEKHAHAYMLPDGGIWYKSPEADNWAENLLKYEASERRKNAPQPDKDSLISRIRKNWRI